MFFHTAVLLKLPKSHTRVKVKIKSLGIIFVESESNPHE